MIKHDEDLYKVRAKTVSGVTVEGNIDPCLDIWVDDEQHRFKSLKIDKKTISRNTGKKIPDQSGNRVYLYENDVCKIVWKDDLDDETNFEYVFIQYDTAICGFVAINELGGQVDLDGFGDNDVEGLYESIVGNVFDNSELLSAEQKKRLE